MEKVKNFFKDEEKRVILFMLLSGISLVVSFFDIGKLPLDAAWLSIILCGVPIVKEAIIGLVTSFDIKADLLVSIALIASIIINQIFAAGEVAFIMTIGAFLEERTVNKARAGIEKLVHLTPQVARVIRNGIEQMIPADKIQIGDIIKVLAGEIVAVDGTIISGKTSIDQSVMTGESLPVDKETGDQVFSGTLNQFGTFNMKATKLGEDSSLQRMIKLVKSADASKAKIVGIADRWATWIVAGALSTAILTWFATGEIIRSVTILVVFCPCALVLATPTAIMAGIGNATKYGILIREGDALERLANVRRISFDKTGTLTYGQLSVTAVENFNTSISKETLLQLTASAEIRSEHPLGKAIIKYIKNIPNISINEPDEFKVIAGRGVQAKINNYSILAGNIEMMADNNISIPERMDKKASRYKGAGCTIMYISINGNASGFIALSDTLREDAIDMIKAIERTKVKSILLTGDNRQAACHIAKLVGIDDICSNCLPEDKISAIEKYQSKNEPVCMVGDGVNDALALKKAYVGIAMGGIGSDIAIDAADIALIRDDIKCIPHLLSLAKKVTKTIKLNLTFSMALNFIAVVLAILGILGPVVGALVHNAGSVLVILNSSLLLNWKGR
ncbi:MAG: cation-translocating P-type ATPase [Clostridium sp.]|jgi:heavy metal translocating P-type ATPase|uniref:heavy metal translocating P-type ATPase n=1 Tax=Clostridium sp. TaxID=1506 RepID=UPI0025BF3BE2|nr:cation-translocating P-type ATPase [Clostridium sp.]MCH3965165.1 cation-translocating P-type ATPase [Clostridium sp.]MCI1714386.1 cation-translocating P-type ATPase [Clostridium sp.]MCI1798648.1 cation-translocating P-type ATPase [Clostridium sp.]MCI1812621.1 cation-translocating P-type ATPase [Clostridium sp.]MCI1869457.1 cation-translocating P-type ATPase [Clostridium sp.]